MLCPLRKKKEEIGNPWNGFGGNSKAKVERNSIISKFSLLLSNIK